MNGGRDVVVVRAPSEPATVAPAGRNVIVAIGIDRYRNARWSALRNAVNDAVGATEAFQQLGFVALTPPLLDQLATRDAMNRLVNDELARMLRPADSLVVFYAGHGGVRSQPLDAREVNTGYLVPVDAGEPYASWIELKPWLDQIARLPPRHILVILDACKSGIALSDALTRTRDSDTVLARPFAGASRKRSRLLITSADEGELALDSGPRLGHSLFTGCLIDALIGGGPLRFVHDGQPMTVGSNLGHHVRNLVQSYPGEDGKRQTPVVGRFRHDDHGEMLIPSLAGEHTGSRRLLAQGSNELPVTTGEAAAGESGESIAPGAAKLPRRIRPRIAAAAVLVVLAGAALGAVGWRPRSEEPPRAGSGSPARNEPADPQVSVLMPAESADADAGVAKDDGGDAAVASGAAAVPTAGSGAGAAPAVGSAAGAAPAVGAGAMPAVGADAVPAVGAGAVPAVSAAAVPAVSAAAAPALGAGAAPTLGAGAAPTLGTMTGAGAAVASAAAISAGEAGDSATTTHSAGGALTWQHSAGGAPGRQAFGAPVHQAVPMAPAGSSQRDVSLVTRAPAMKPRTCLFRCLGSNAITVEGGGQVARLPADLLLPCGVEVDLRFTQPHRVSSQRKVTASSTSTSTKIFRMNKLTAVVVVTSKPTGATISLGKRMLGVTPTPVKLPDTEVVTLTLSKPGFVASQNPITAGVDRKLYVELTPCAP